MPQPEIVCVGELLLDLISLDYAEDFRSADKYQRLPGGSPANLAMNLARLGQKSGLIATVGRDDAGELLIDAVRSSGADVTYVTRQAEPTTLILVTKSQAVSNFEPYRMADRLIFPDQVPQEYLVKTRILHTTAFALSQEPARTTIHDAMEQAAKTGIRLSTDFNYADKIWDGNRVAALLSLRKIAATGALVKVSEVDYERLFEKTVIDYHSAAHDIIAMGASVVCLTLGEEGCFIVHPDGEFHLPARKVEVKDTTGAGDAFWSGFLAAHLEGMDWPTCALAGRGMAERKLGMVGPLTERLSVADLIS